MLGPTLGGRLIVLTFSAAANVGYAVFPRIFGLNGWDILFPQVIAILVAMMIIVGTIRWQDIFSKKAFKIFRPAFASRLLTSAFYFQINSMVWRWLYPPQFNVVIATLGGLFILHEKKTSMQEWFILAGLVLVVVGAVMIGVTKRGGGPNYLFKSTDILVSGDYIHRDP